MRFHHAESMTPFENLVPLAQDAEAHGYAGYMIPDSLIYPESTDAKYSYTEDGGREFLENKPFIESFILATAIGASTTTLEMTTNVVKLPVRPPLYSAKLAASVAAITNNRFNFGVGLSVSLPPGFPKSVIGPLLRADGCAPPQAAGGGPAPHPGSQYPGVHPCPAP